MSPREITCLNLDINNERELKKTNTYIMCLPGSYYCNKDTELTFLGDTSGITALLGYSEEEISSYYKNSLWELVEIESRKELKQKLEAQLVQGNSIELVFQVRHKNGENIWLLNRGYKMLDEQGREYLAGFLLDITSKREKHEKQRKLLEKYQIILSQTENIIFEWDYTMDTIFLSETWESIFGYTPETECFSKVLADGKHFYPGDNHKLAQLLHSMCEGDSYQIVEVRIIQSNGEYLWCRVRATGIYDETGALSKIVGIIIDVDDEKKAACALQERAERDSLTKLFNARTTRKKTEEYLETEGAECALLMIDLDDFKHVNDNMGHIFGDMALTQVANTIRKLFRSMDIIGRIGGDEFMVLLKNISDRALVEKRCSQLLDTVQEIFISQMYGYRVSCSIGVALSPDNGKSYFDLFRCADQALYQAKALGKNQYAFYDEEKMVVPDQKTGEYLTNFFHNTDDTDEKNTEIVRETDVE